MEGARPATAADIAGLAEQYLQAKEELLEFRGAGLLFLRGAPCELAHPDRALRVGTIDEFAVGYAAGRIDDLPAGEATRGNRRPVRRTGGPLGRPGRGQGRVGHRLVRGLRLHRGGRRRPSGKNFFEASGFTARLLVMHKRLNGGG